MSPLSDLLSIKTMQATSFAYTPPAAAYDAVRVLVKADLDRVPPAIMGKVLRGIRRADPGGKVLVVVSGSEDESARARYDASGLESLMDDNMQAIDLAALPVQQYPNRLEKPDIYRNVPGPALIDEVDCRLSVSVVQPGIPAALDTLMGLIPPVPQHATGHKDLYFTLGYRFEGAVVVVGDQVIWGDDLLAVDTVALRSAGHEPLPLLDELRRLRESMAR